MRIVSIAGLCALLAACATRPPADHVALPPAPPKGEPANMEGLSATALKAAFGTPVFVRKDGDTELWRYDGTACKAWFFLYPANNVLTVKHVETSPRPANAAFDAACLTSLHRAPAPVS